MYIHGNISDLIAKSDSSRTLATRHNMAINLFRFFKRLKCMAMYRVGKGSKAQLIKCAQAFSNACGIMTWSTADLFYYNVDTPYNTPSNKADDIECGIKSPLVNCAYS